MDISSLGSGDSSLRLGVLSAADAAQCFACAQREFAYEKMVGTTGKPLPRVQCLQARAQFDGTLPVYRYPGNEEGVRYPTHLLSPLTEQMCALAQRELEQASPDTFAAAALADGEPYFNHVVVNYYRSESDFIASHQDKRLDIARNSVIAALSVYPSPAMVDEEEHVRPCVAPRQLELLSTDGLKRRQVVSLPQGSLFLLGDKTNQEWQHSVRPLLLDGDEVSSARVAQARISFTMRRCATFRTLDGKLRGQGAGYVMTPDGSVRGVAAAVTGSDTKFEGVDGGRGGGSSSELSLNLRVLYADPFYVAVAKPGAVAVETVVAAATTTVATAVAAGTIVNAAEISSRDVSADTTGATACPPSSAAALAGDAKEALASDKRGLQRPPSLALLRTVGLVPVEQGASGVLLLARTEAAARALLSSVAAVAGDGQLGGGDGNDSGDDGRKNEESCALIETLAVCIGKYSGTII